MAWTVPEFPWSAHFDTPARRAPAVRPETFAPILEPTLFVVPTMDTWFMPLSEPVRPPHSPMPPSFFGNESLRGRYYFDARGKYRIFNAAEYRFYRSNSAPPVESDTPFETNSTLPHTTTATFANGTWWMSMSYFNGVVDSGFLPVGSRGETFLRLDIAAGVEIDSPPAAPVEWRIAAVTGGVVRVIGIVAQSGDLSPDDWAIGYTIDASTPPADTPDVTVAIDGVLAVLSYDLPAQANGTTVKVRLQTTRDDGTYSDDSTVLTATASTAGPSIPAAGGAWPGRIPEGM